jgi:hypothetical protein
VVAQDGDVQDEVEVLSPVAEVPVAEVEVSVAEVTVPQPEKPSYTKIFNKYWDSSKAEALAVDVYPEFPQRFTRLVKASRKRSILRFIPILEYSYP